MITSIRKFLALAATSGTVLSTLAQEAFPLRPIHLLLLRNPSLANLLERCALSVPCHRVGEAPVGLMLIGEHGADLRLLSIGRAAEPVVSPEH